VCAEKLAYPCGPRFWDSDLLIEIWQSMAMQKSTAGHKLQGRILAFTTQRLGNDVPGFQKAEFKVCAASPKTFRMGSLWNDKELDSNWQGSLRCALMNLRPCQLQKICKRHRLRPEGRKKHLVERLLSLEKGTQLEASMSRSSTADTLDPMWMSWDRDAITKAFHTDFGAFRSRIGGDSSDEGEGELDIHEVYGGLDTVGLSLHFDAEPTRQLQKATEVELDGLCSGFSHLSTKPAQIGADVIEHVRVGGRTGSTIVDIEVTGLWPRLYDHTGTPMTLLKLLVAVMKKSTEGDLRTIGSVGAKIKDLLGNHFGGGGRNAFHEFKDKHGLEFSEALSQYQAQKKRKQAVSSPVPTGRRAAASPAMSQETAVSSAPQSPCSMGSPWPCPSPSKSKQGLSECSGAYAELS
jgi:hypothetical protein